MRDCHASDDGDIIAIDGKTLRHSILFIPTGSYHAFLLSTNQPLAVLFPRSTPVSICKTLTRQGKHQQIENNSLAQRITPSPGTTSSEPIR